MGDEKPGSVRFLTDFSAGSRIAGYRLEEQIGRGGTAVVFRALDERLPRQVALKILSPTLAADEEFRHLRDEGMAVLYAHLSEPPRMTSRRQDLPAAVDGVLLRALAKTPEDRYLTCGEFADELRVASGLQRYDSDVAIALRQQTLTDQRRALGPDHPDTLIVRFGIAQEMAERGDHAGAAREFRGMLPYLRRRLGPDHPHTLAAAEQAGRPGR